MGTTMPKASRTRPYYTCPIPSCPNTLPKQPLPSPYPPHCTGNGTHKPTEMKVNVDAK